MLEGFNHGSQFVTSWIEGRHGKHDDKYAQERNEKPVHGSFLSLGVGQTSTCHWSQDAQGSDVKLVPFQLVTGRDTGRELQDVSGSALLLEDPGCSVNHEHDAQTSQKQGAPLDIFRIAFCFPRLLKFEVSEVERHAKHEGRWTPCFLPLLLFLRVGILDTSNHICHKAGTCCDGSTQLFIFSLVLLYIVLRVFLVCVVAKILSTEDHRQAHGDHDQHCSGSDMKDAVRILLKATPDSCWIRYNFYCRDLRYHILAVRERES
mmetsp:Transcript_46304/g.83501  ORF Transcript_46304/g.83501 Transcript_46304/m.83501 type:complete len:262 (-) Transcript_46304:145-930(-)